jgi:acyl-CoA synthetase (NDP forming)
MSNREYKQTGEKILGDILTPSSIVFFGASNNPMTFGTGQFLNITNRYRRNVYPIHPDEEEIFGVKAYKKVEDTPEDANLAIMVLPTHLVPKFLACCGEKGIKRAIIISAGFKEVGEVDLQNEIISIARKYGIRFLGPNCIGIYNAYENLNTTWIPYFPKKGGISIVSQSGTFACHPFPYFIENGIGIDKSISVGNEADIDIVDCLEYLEDESNTNAIAMYIEGIRRGRKFIEVARRVNKKKPIVVLYVGGTEAGSRAGKSHTSALSGPDHVYDAVFRQCGLIRAYNIEELFDYSLALASQPVPKGGRIGILTDSGGSGAVMADTCERMGLNVPILSEDIQNEIRSIVPSIATVTNPIDITTDFDVSHFYVEIPEILLKDPSIDGILLYGLFGSSIFKRFFKSVKTEIDGLISIYLVMLDELLNLCERYRKPVLASSFIERRDEEVVVYFQDHDVPVYPSPERAAKAMSALVEYSRAKRKEKSDR